MAVGRAVEVDAVAGRGNVGRWGDVVGEAAVFVEVEDYQAMDYMGELMF